MRGGREIFQLGPCKQNSLVNTASLLQQSASLILYLELYLPLNQGPPGTGKTRVAASIVMHAVRNNVKVLVMAETNIAVDNLAMKIWNRVSVNFRGRYQTPLSNRNLSQDKVLRGPQIIQTS